MTKTKFRATRSFYGDLGNFRRNQIVELDAGDKTVKELVSKELLTTDLEVSRRPGKPVGGVKPKAEKKLEDLNVEQLKAFAAKNNIALGDATKKADILAAIQLATEAAAA